jgi:hypothetical protein
MKKSWLYWSLVIAIVLVVFLMVYGLLFGFSGEGSRIVDGNVERNSFLGGAVDFIDNNLRGGGTSNAEEG